jgi:GT2 family glycosyltransferase
MKRPLVYIIIVNWNGWRDTLECVTSCRKLAYDNVRIIVIDNGSSDDSDKILRHSLPDIEVIQSGSNLGFAGGNNVGIRLALERGAQYLWLLNNDTVVDPAALSALVEPAEHDPHVGIVGSKIYYFSTPRRLWFAGGFWKFGKIQIIIRGEGEEDKGLYDHIIPVDFVTGCSLLIRAETVRDIGLLEEKYFLYWEDTDWNARAREKGWKILYNPHSTLWHKVSSSFNLKTDEQAYYYLRSKLLFHERHAPLILPLSLALIILGALRHIAQGRIHFARGYFSGMKDYFLRRFGIRTPVR